ncbi:V-set domain-containing T-cell activation inhibitor 1-like isoform X2 [Halichoeres trimaculatus]|uniref:V-set domain-containing T-cell activation inhibitor 1-like isoform X2 n=1 Tax=Halichoeres trimaculatus TaxID=147232 RepID=UPI003D9F38B2
MALALLYADHFTVLSLLSLLGTLHALENGELVVTVKEDSDAVLPCAPSSRENLDSKLFDWKKDVDVEVFIYHAYRTYGNGFTGQNEQFVGRVSHFPDHLKNGNASIKITKTKVSDSGTYTCEFPHFQPRQIFSTRLVVVASSKPYIEMLNQTQDWALLQCEVRGVFPEPKLMWKDSAGNILPAEESERYLEGNKYYITLKTNVTRTDQYSCIVRQEELKHEIPAKIFLLINGKPEKEAESSLAPLVFGILAVGCLAGVLTLAAGQLLAVKKCAPCRYRVMDYLSGLKPQRDFRQKNDKHHENGNITNGGPADIPESLKIPLTSSNDATSS